MYVEENDTINNANDGRNKRNFDANMEYNIPESRTIVMCLQLDIHWVAHTFDDALQLSYA